MKAAITAVMFSIMLLSGCTTVPVKPEFGEDSQKFNERAETAQKRQTMELWQAGGFAFGMAIGWSGTGHYGEAPIYNPAFGFCWGTMWSGLATLANLNVYNEGWKNAIVISCVPTGIAGGIGGYFLNPSWAVITVPTGIIFGALIGPGIMGVIEKIFTPGPAPQQKEAN